MKNHPPLVVEHHIQEKGSNTKKRQRKTFSSYKARTTIFSCPGMSVPLD
jgi:hypothetical protein